MPDGTAQPTSPQVDWDSVYHQAATAYGVDPDLLKAIRVGEGTTENPYQVSEAGAAGPFQLMPETAKAYGVDDRFDPLQSAHAAARNLRENMDRYGSPEMAILAYHGGTDQSQWGPKTHQYLNTVQDAYSGLKNAAAVQPAAPVVQEPAAAAMAPAAPAPIAKTDLQARIAAARQAGYTDQQIADTFARSQTFGPRINAAKQAGYDDNSIFGAFGLSLVEGGVGPFIERAAKGTAQSAISSTGQMMQGIGAAQSAMRPYLEPYYDDYLAYQGMTTDQKQAVQQKILTDKHLMQSDVQKLLYQFSDAEQNGPRLGPTEFFGKRPEDTGLFKAGQKVEDSAGNLIPMTPAEQGTFSAKVGENVGAMLPVMAAGAVTGGAGLPVGAAMFAAQSGGQGRAEAEGLLPDSQAGLPPTQRNYDAAAENARERKITDYTGGQELTGLVVGGADVGVLLKPIERSAPGLMPWAVAKLKQAARGGVTFAGIGEAQQWLGTELKKDIDPKSKYDFDPERIATELASGALFGPLGHTEVKGTKPADVVPPAAGAEQPPPDGGTGGPPPDDRSKVAPILPKQEPPALRTGVPPSDDGAGGEKVSRETSPVTDGRGKPILDYAKQHVEPILSAAEKARVETAPPDEGTADKSRGQVPGIDIGRGDASRVKNAPDLPIRPPDLARDLVDAQTRPSESYGAGDPSMSRMLQAVLMSSKDPEIFRGIVQSIPVDVMNILAGPEGSAEHLRSDPSMFVHALAVNGDLPVGRYAVLLAVRNMAGPIAEHFGADLAAHANADQATIGAGDLNAHLKTPSISATDESGKSARKRPPVQQGAEKPPLAEVGPGAAETATPELPAARTAIEPEAQTTGSAERPVSEAESPEAAAEKADQTIGSQIAEVRAGQEMAAPGSQPVPTGTEPPFNKGDRVQITGDSPYAGRHGTVSEVNSLTMRPIFGGGPSDTTHVMRVKTDSGVEAVISPRNLAVESGEAPKAVPDILFGNEHTEPAAFASSIVRDQSDAKLLRARADRARKAEHKKTLREDAKRLTDRAEEKDDVLTKWKMANHDEANRLFPERVAGKVPTSSVESSTAVPTGWHTAETKHTKTGKDLFVATADDRMSPEEFKRVSGLAKDAGGFYSSFRGKGAIPGFQFPSDAERTKFMASLGPKAEAAKPAALARQVIGENADGHAIEEDAKGIRSYVSPEGVRHTEQVQLIPTRAGIETRPRVDRDDEWKTEAERGVPVLQSHTDKPIAELFGRGANMIKLLREDPTLGEMEIRHRLENAAVNPRVPDGTRETAKAALHMLDNEQRTPEKSTSYGSENKVFTAGAADAARARLRAKMGRVSAGFDPTMMLDLMQIGGFHVESGARSFAAFSAKMLADLGDDVRPYLRSIYESIRHYPGAEHLAREMTAPDQISEEAGRGLQNDLRPSDEGAGAEAVQRTGEVGPTRSISSGEESSSTRNASRPAEGRAEGPGRGTVEPSEGTSGGGAGAGRVPGLPDAGARAEPRAARRPSETVDADVQGTNYRIDQGGLAETRSPRVKLADNLAAIDLAKKLIAEQRTATRAEQEVLAKYVGWGGLSGAFRNSKGVFGKGFEDAGARLEGMLTEAEHKAASSSTQYAHYTAENVVRSMWDAVRRLGFDGGSVFEPGMGTGNFVGMMPADLGERTHYQGIEIDPLTADIAKLLYPKSGIRQADFIRTPMPEQAFDLVIGNPPFSDTVIKGDPKYAARGFMLHDYFFAKSLDSVRPGGLLAFVTSAGTMNKLDDAARKFMAERAEFLGGVRLPSTAFKKSAGTEVTTDVLFFKRRPEGRVDLEEGSVPPWTGTVARELPNAEGITSSGNVSRYFSEHPENILGKEGFFDKLYKGRYAVHEEPGRDLDSSLREFIGRLPENVMEKAPTPEERAEMDFASGQKKDGSYYLKDGQLWQYRDGVGKPVGRRGKGVEGGMTGPDMERIRHLIPMRDALRDVFRADLADNADDGTRARTALNKHYDKFVKQFGPLNQVERQFRRPSRVQQEAARAEAREDARADGRTFEEGDFDPRKMIGDKKSWAEISRVRQEARDSAVNAGREFDEGTFDPDEMPDVVTEKRPNIDPFHDDPEHYRMRAIERYDDATGKAEKRDIFFRNILTKEVEPEIKSAGDGIMWSLNKLGRLDIDQIAQKLGKPRDGVIQEMGDAIFRVPGTTDTYHTRDEYLSGDVVSKLETARAEAAKDDTLQRNVEALEKAQPQPLPPSQISMGLGMPWIPHDVVKRFASDELKIGDLGINHSDVTGQWAVDSGNRYDPAYGEGTPLWQTADRRAHELLSDALNRTPPRIYTYDADRKPVYDAVATEAALTKYEGIRQAFSDWLGRDTELKNTLADLYNNTLNRVVLRQYDGSYLTTPGVSKDWSWRPHQTRVVARIVQSGNTYMAHAVGAGKTSAMIGAGMEMRRLGLVRKPMYAVPNHMLGQFAKEFYEQYPTARIAVADERNFHTDRRKQFIANVSQDDLDAIIITHSAFGKVPISDTFQSHLVEEELDRYREALNDVDATDRITVKRIENQIEKLKERLSASGAGGGGKDLGNTFEELGVDFLFVDEAHQFRKLAFATQQKLKGIDPDGSNMAWDLYSKLRYLDGKQPGRSVVLASGTPVTNTMGELYTISRYLQRQALEERGLSHFDSWAQTFGDTKLEIEEGADGRYQPVTRFAKFVNIPELYKMVGGVMDVVTPHELAKYVVRPALEGGGRQYHLAPRTDFLDAYQQTLKERVDAIRARKGPPKKGDDILLSVINDGRHSAIDPRLVDPNYGANDPSAVPSKLNDMLERAHTIWENGKQTQFYDPGSNYTKPTVKGQSTQMVFLNLGINPRGPGAGFSAYRWIKQDLMRRGVPADQIAFIKDYPTAVLKQKLFNDMNEGKVRVLIGSTQKMGTGVNAQKRLVAIHNMDPLWYPADDEQRVGRGVRQGNMNPQIGIHDYSTKGTYDSVMWQMMGRKGRFIEQFFRGDPNLREMEDLGEAGMYEQAAAMATTDDRIIRLTELKHEYEKLERQASAHDMTQYSMRGKRGQYLRDAEYDAESIDRVKKDIAQRTDTTGDAFRATIAGKEIDNRADAGKALEGAVNAVNLATVGEQGQKIGEIGGFPIRLKSFSNLTSDGKRFLFPNLRLVLGGDREREIASGAGFSGISALRSAESTLRGFDASLKSLEASRAENLQRANDIVQHLGKPFEGAEQLAKSKEAYRTLNAQIEADNKPKQPEAAPGQLEESGSESEEPGPHVDKLSTFKSEVLGPRTGQQWHEGARGFVTGRANDPGHEYLAAYDRRTGEVTHASTNNLPRAVTFSDTLSAELRNPDNSFIIHHGHPTGTSLSRVDVGALVNYPGIDWIVAHTPDGQISTARLSAPLRGRVEKIVSSTNPTNAEEGFKRRTYWANALKEAYVQITASMDAIFRHAIFNDKLLTVDEANKAVGEIVNRTLARIGAIDYVSSKDLAFMPRDLMARLQSRADAAGAMIKSAAPILKGLPNGPDRSASYLRSDEGMADIFERARNASGYRPGDTVRDQESQAGIGQAGGSGGLEAEPDRYMPESEEPIPEPEKTRAAALTAQLRGPLRKVLESAPAQRVINGEAFQNAMEAMGKLRRDIGLIVNPLSVGPDHAIASAKDFANEQRRIAYHLGVIDNMIKKTYTPEERAKMGRAKDQESEMRQDARDQARETLEGRFGEEVRSDAQGWHFNGRLYKTEAGVRRSFEKANMPNLEHEALSDILRQSPDKGLQTLPPDQRAVVEMIDGMLDRGWAAMKDAGIVHGEGLPMYMPRQFVKMLADGEITHVSSGEKGITALDPLGGNLTTAGPQHRKYRYAEESEAAAKTKLGGDTKLVTDIRAALLAVSRAQRSVAGKNLIQAIRDAGDKTGIVAVQDEPGPGVFTIDHPAFHEFGPAFRIDDEGKVVMRKDDQGNPLFKRSPIYVSREFEGPLRAVLTKPPGAIFRSLMAIKRFGVRLIMMSPMTHNTVIYGRAFELMPGKMLTFRAYVDGNKLRKDPAAMDEAIHAGMVPITGGWWQDVVGVAREAGRPEGWWARKPGEALGKGASAVARTTAGAPKWVQDNLHYWAAHPGEFWENTLLWNRVADVQAGIYQHVLNDAISRGMSRKDAAVVAAHIANRFAGAMPAEYTSNIARKISNLCLFSPSFTYGNLGVVKDAFVGLPAPMRAQISRDSGRIAANMAKSYARRRAVGALIRSFAFYYGTNALLQMGIGAVRQWNQDPNGDAYDKLGRNGQDIVGGFARRWGELVDQRSDHPLDWLNPIDDLERMMPNHDNEPGKENRIFYGIDDQGRALYIRNIVGKSIEEIRNWILQPREELLAKTSTLVKPLVDILQNADYYGKRVYDPGSGGLSDDIGAVGSMVWHFMQSQVPITALQGGYDYITGAPEAGLSLAKSILPFATGVTVSRGYTAGPQGAIERQVMQQHEQTYLETYPKVVEAVKRGDIDKARQLLTDAGETPHEVTVAIQNLLQPLRRTGPHGYLGRAFERYAKPEDRERFEHVTQ